MVKERKVSWAFPYKSFIFMRLETVTVAILAILVFFASFMSFDQQWFHAVLFTVIFLVIYGYLSYMIQKFRRVHEHYEINKTHLTMTKKTRKKTKKSIIPLKNIKHHKLDKVFLGGYVVNHQGKKFVLFFNSKTEVEKFEQFLSKHLKPAKAVVKPVKKPVRKRVTKKKTVKKKGVKKKTVKKRVVKKKPVRKRKK